MNHKWTPDELEIVRRDYQGDSDSVQRIAHSLGVSFYAVKGQISKLGCAKITDRQRWTPAQDEQLEDLIPRMSLLQVAKRMRRSVFSITVRAKRIGISRRDRNGWYTKNEVAAILGVDHKWIQKRIDIGALKASQLGGVPGKEGGALWCIREADLRRFIRQYPEELNGRNVDLIQIVDILIGVEAVGYRGTE